MHFTELLDGVFRVLRSRFTVFLPIALIFMGTGPFLMDLSSRLVFQPGRWTGVAEGAFFLLALLIYSFSFLVLQPLLSAAAAGTTSYSLRKERLTLREALKIAGRHSGPSIAAWLFLWILIAGGWIILAGLLFVPAVLARMAGAGEWIFGLGAFIFFPAAGAFFLFIMTRFFLIIPVIVEEKTAIFGAMKRSWQLTRSSFWRTMSLMIVLGLLTFSYQFVVSILSQSLFIPEWPWVLHGPISLFMTVFYCIPQVLPPILATLIYFDRRCRYEAMDLQAEIDGWNGESALPPLSKERWPS
ncbi:hypothetical protein CHM34_00725 [Paludifilum halophilum]|uniref:Glycerophosphoryl diester phosphodiesterase membrane domain-containing protein n=2 Tax=Paludifilum halophilum TaxID=1642702 RepID=A0A235BBI3_9BACL|nr:hypothetical protein CHM34_00725 [Paludifilum halophilum]